MFEAPSQRLLRVLRVPPAPEPPFGAPGSVRVFRAGHNFFRLRLFVWGFKQALALAGIIFWAVVFIQVEQTLKARHQAGRTPVAPTSAKDFGEYMEKIGAGEEPVAPVLGSNSPAAAMPGTAVTAAASPEVKQEQAQAQAKSRDNPKKKRPRVRINGWAGFKQMLVEVGMFLPPRAFPFIWALKIAGFVFYLAQVPLTYALMRLDYEQRWYLVTDRSLRLRHGVWRVQEMTMSFANLQQIAVTQGPVQRLLGLADVRVQSAGGGGGAAEAHTAAGASMHTGFFHGVDNAEAIRDLITERLRQFRESGLGDPDEKREIQSLPPAVPADANTMAAAKELLAEARALRGVLG